MFDFIAFMFHDHKEVADIVGILDSISQVRFQHGAEGGLASTLPEPLDVTHGLSGLTFQNHRQPVLPAQPV